MDENLLFYVNIVRELIKNKNSSILVCGGSIEDAKVFRLLDFSNVMISGLFETHDDFTPYLWQKENAEFLSFIDESFDYVVMHEAIHHTQLPHKVLTELYRVAKKGILVIEGRDSLLIRLAERLGYSQEYEVAGTYHGMGVNGTEIPNYIFRWTEREVEKTIKSFSPFYKHKIIYRYGSLYPNGPDLNKSQKLTLYLLRPFYYLLTLVSD